MPSIYCHDPNTDENLILNFLSGYVVGITDIDGDECTVLVTGAGRTDAGLLTLVGKHFDDELGAPTNGGFWIVWDDVTDVEVY